MRERRDRVLVTAAAVIPDLDGIGIIPELITRNSSHPLAWFTEYHHLALHNLSAAIMICAVMAVAAKRRMKVFALSLLSYHLHLLGDVLGSRGPDGYQWPIPYLNPLSKVEWSWKGQWALASWQNLLITIAMLAASYVVIRMKRISPAEVFSKRADAAIVNTLT
jgi:inner membrane protein